MKRPFSIDNNVYNSLFGQPPGLTHGELARVHENACQTIWDFIAVNSTVDWSAETLSDYQIASLREAAMEQAAFVINNGGDISRWAGIGIDGSIAPFDPVKYELAPKARQILTRSGFLYRGLGGC